MTKGSHDAAPAPPTQAPPASVVPDDKRDFWSNGDDEIEVSPSLLRFTVRGKPAPQAHHRTSKFGKTYDPSMRPKKEFRNVIQSIISRSSVSENQPYFGSKKVGVTLVFRFSRPKSHWVGGRRGGELKAKFAPLLFPTGRGDIDNLQKFVFDALNGVAYVDDGQVASCCATKVIDNIGTCEGATVVSIFPLSDEMLLNLSKGKQHGYV